MLFLFLWNWTQTWFDFYSYTSLCLSFFCFEIRKEINLKSVLINHLRWVEMCIKWFFHGQPIKRINSSAFSEPARILRIIKKCSESVLQCIRRKEVLTLKKLLQCLRFLWLFHNILTSNTTRRVGKAREKRRKNNDWLMRQWLFIFLHEEKRQHDRFTKRIIASASAEKEEEKPVLRPLQRKTNMN